MTKTQIATREQSIEEIFVNELDMIYYPGYAQEIIESDPEKFDKAVEISLDCFFYARY